MTSRALSVVIASALLALSACSPAADAPAEKSGADIPTPKNPFFGTWHMTTAVVAPWWDHVGAEPTASADMATFTLAAGKSTGPALLTCDKPAYATNIAPQRGLFQGNLPDPQKDAPALGFTSPDIIVMSFTCASGAGDVSLDFPMRDDDTIMLGLDNMIYTYKRAAG